MEDLKEVIQFLQTDSRLDLKAVSLSYILSLTGSADGIELIINCPEVLKCILKLTTDETKTIAKDAALCLVNISATENGANDLLRTNDEKTNLIQLAVNNILDENNQSADAWTMVLSNVTRPHWLVEKVIEELTKESKLLLDKLVACYTKIDFNKQKSHLNYLGSLFSNLSQSLLGRKLLCDSTGNLFKRLLPFIQYENSIIRKGSAIGLLKNVCFDPLRHEWLLETEMNVLPFILLPLAGPEEFDDEINECLPTELQYLDQDKKREEDPDLRLMLIESLAQLCATKYGREYLRKHSTYEILREYHKWECRTGLDKRCNNAVDNVIHILIRTEYEIAEDNLKDLNIPEDIVDKFNKLNDENDEK